MLQPLAGAAGGLQALFEPKARLTNPGVSWAVTNAQRQLFYPPWLEGTWDVAARFVGASFPLGQAMLSREVPGACEAARPFNCRADGMLHALR